MKTEKWNTLKLFLFSGVMLALFRIFFGMYYEEGTDPYFITIFSGVFTSGPDHVLNTYGFHFITSWLYKLLYGIFPGFPWYDAVIFILISLTLTFIFQLLFYLFHSNNFRIFSLAGISSCVAVLLILSESLVLIQVTRVVFLLCISSAALLYLEVEISFLRKFLLNGCLVFALLSRIEPALLAIAVVFPWAVLYGGLNKENFRQIFKSWLFFGSMCILVSILLNIPFDSADRSYKLFRPYQFTLWDFRQPGISPVLESKKDSVILQAAEKSFLTDSSNINPRFFQRVGIIQLDKSPAYVLNYFRDIKSRWGELRTNLARCMNVYPWLIFSVVIFSLIAGIVIYLVEKKRFLSFVTLQACFLFVLIGVAAFMKMEERVFAPMIQAHFLLSYLFVLNVILRRTTFNYILTLCCAFIYFLNLVQAFTFTSAKVESRRVTSRYINRATEEISLKHSSKIVWVNLHVMDRLFIPLFSPHTLPQNVSWASLDNAILFYYPSWHDKIQRYTLASGFEGIIHAILKDPSTHLFFSTVGRMQLIKDYCEYVNGIVFSFEEIPSQFNQKFREEFPGYQTPYKIGLFRIKSIAEVEE